MPLFDGQRFMAKQAKRAQRTIANMKDPARGTATVVSSSDYRPVLGSGVSMSGAWECSMTCVVRAEGVAPQSAHFDGDAPTSRWPWPGTQLPITIDRAEPNVWVVHWDQVPTGHEASQAAADALAAGMRGAIAGDGPQPATVSPVDLTERLAKLAELHAAGALSDAEFAAAKAKLLDP